MREQRYTVGADGVLRIKLRVKPRSYRSADDVNPPEVVAACRFVRLLHWVGELPELKPYHDALLSEIRRQGVGKESIENGQLTTGFSFPELVASLKHPK